MANKSFILVNLEETKSKKLAQVISNETSRKILDLLAKKENTVTETEISKEMNLPLSTVHYNLKQLVEVNLIESDEYHYSEKMKEVNHYKLTNKFVIIAPSSQKIETIARKLKKVLPVALVSFAGAGFVYLFSGIQQQSFSLKAASAPMMEASSLVMQKAADTAMPAIQQQAISPLNVALIFLAGAVLAIAAFFVIDIIRKSKK